MAGETKGKRRVDDLERTNHAERGKRRKRKQGKKRGERRSIRGKK